MYKKLVVMGLTFLVMLVLKVSCNAAEMLQTTDFKRGVSLPWQLSQSDEANATASIKDGNFVVHIDNKGTNRRDVQIRHRDLTIYSGYQYRVKFSVTADKDTKIYAKIGDVGEPYEEVWNNKWNTFSIKAGEVLTVEDTFIADKTYKDAEFAFQLGGELINSLSLPIEVKFISMSLDDYTCRTPNPTATPLVKDIRVNQLGYLPNATKKAVLKVYGTPGEPQKWDLMDKDGNVVASGNTTVFGPDYAAGEYVQIIDFSSYTIPGKDYYLVAGNAESFPFDIGTDIYTNMKYDALKYFYHARSGLEIKMPYCVESVWSRPAGHKEDIVVPASVKDYTGPKSIDATGGWYDAGDHGKYMVNGGLTLWILQNQYEHSKKYGVDDIFGDGRLNIPESGNKINDLLDETRWEMEWMLKMQIPEGYDRAGMAIHKVGDENWTSLAIRPDQDTEKRLYYAPTTAATLNLAACAAQAARIWKDIDAEFSAKCLNASKRAYEAAKANPAIFYPYSAEKGSLSYGDNYVEDDFYWAACELYVTTGEEEYLTDLEGYEESQKMPVVLTGEFEGLSGCFDRCATGGLGTLTLALHKGQEFPQAVASIREAADDCIEIQEKEGYRIPLVETEYIDKFFGNDDRITGYPIDSNSYIINKAIVMAYAYELCGDEKYFNGMVECMDYLLGRNPMIKSYVSGYGENTLKNPHHRFFCNQYDESFPPVPPGFLTGGPNSGCQDEIARKLRENRAPAQKCYVDDVESWSTNEVKVNLNAALSWVTYYLDVAELINESIIEDINKDGSVNMADVVLIAKVFGLTKNDEGFDKKCDINLDGTVNMSDIIKLARKFGYMQTE